MCEDTVILETLNGYWWWSGYISF